MIGLRSGCIYMPFPERRLFLRIWSGTNSMRTSVITNPVIGRVVMHNNSIIDINIMNNRTIYIDYGSIISEGITLPSASVETGAIIAITVVHAAVKTDMRSPVPRMKTIIATRISPISGCP